MSLRPYPATALLAASLVALGCAQSSDGRTGPQVTDPLPDSGHVAQEAPDAGDGDRDAGAPDVPPADAGEPLPDAGAGEPDAGSVEVDAGETTDRADAGVVATIPAQVLDLSSWKLTLPVGSGTKPTEIFQPQLSTFALAPWFRVAPQGGAVAFRANCGGVTTSNSGYPRSELREMAGAGDQQASWSTTSGLHTMTITQAITHLPVAKPHVVAGQIHDASDDVIMIRLEGRHLFVEGGGSELGDLDADYALGRVFTVKIEAGNGHIRVWYDGVLKLDLSRAASACYFKAGCYTQSNTSKGDDPEAYGEVEIRALEVTHQ